MPDAPAPVDANQNTDADSNDAGQAGLYVNPGSGNDANICSSDSPCKTITHALGLASDGMTVRLYGGTYSTDTGEQFPVSVPDGVSLEAVAQDEPLVLGTPSLTALIFEGSGAIRSFRLEAFGYGIQADTGAIEVSGIRFVHCGAAAHVSGAAKMAVSDSVIDGGGAGYEMYTAATVTMTGGSISNLGPNCGGSVGGAYLQDAANLTLDGVTVADNLGTIELRGASTATFRGCTFNSNGPVGCGGENQVEVSEAASLATEDTTFTGGLGSAIRVSGGSLSMTGGHVSAASGSVGIDARNGLVLVDGTSFTSHQKSATCLAVDEDGAARVSAATFSSCDTAISVQGGQLTPRQSELSGNVAGLRILTTGASAHDDLGTTSDPGGNTIRANDANGVVIEGTSTLTIQAAGNTWVPNTQGADSNGQMLSGTVYAASGFDGLNFYILNAGATLLF